jgi:uncharacterized damage-inducible protein DinB
MTCKEANMYKDAANLFAKYNKIVNKTMDGIIKTLRPEEWDRDLGGYFKSVRGLCSHLYICDFNWLRRFRNYRDFSTLKGPFFDKPYSFSELLFEDSGEYLSKRPELDDKIISFISELNDSDMEGILKYTDSEGESYERVLGGCVLHFLNHETHHRGVTSLYLEMLGRKNDFCSLTQCF